MVSEIIHIFFFIFLQSWFFVTMFIGSGIHLETGARVGLNPVEVGLVTVRNWKNSDVWNWIIVFSWVIVVDVVDQFGDFAVFCGDLEGHSSALSRWSTELEVRSLEASLLQGNGGAELVFEEILDESGGVLLSINGEIDNGDSTGRGGLKRWSFEVLSLQVLWLVDWGNFIVTIWQLVGLLWAWCVNLTGVLLALVETVLVNLVDLHHSISLSIRLILHDLVIGLSNFTVWTSLIGNNGSGVLDSRGNERLILKLFVNVFEKFLIFVGVLFFVDLILHLGRFVFSILLLTHRLNGGVLVIDINLLIFKRALSLSETDITPGVGGSGKDCVFFLSSLEHGSIVRDGLNLVVVSK